VSPTLSHCITAIPRGLSPITYFRPINGFAGRSRLAPPWGVPAWDHEVLKDKPHISLTFRADYGAHVMWGSAVNFQTDPIPSGTSPCNLPGRRPLLSAISGR
jgi:hypothetical protein